MPRTANNRRVTSQADIAREAKVSTATVSRVLNKSPLVREEVRARVSRAMERLGYFPHGAARALVLNRSMTIGAVVPTLDNDIFARGINALMNTLRDNEFTLIVSSCDYSLATEGVLVRRLLERGVDGVFLVGAQRRRETIAMLQRSGKPFVNAYISTRRDAGPCIGFSNAQAAAVVVDHLVRLGHRRIAMFAGVVDGNDRAAQRLIGARRRLRQHGLDFDPEWTVELPYTIQAAKDAFAERAARLELPTAIIAANDILALGVLFEAAHCGIEVPRHLSLVGFDNHPMTAHIHPSLTTIDVPADRMGQIAAQSLLAAIRTGTPIRNVLLDAPLLVRGTTDRPRSG